MVVNFYIRKWNRTGMSKNRKWSAAELQVWGKQKTTSEEQSWKALWTTFLFYQTFLWREELSCQHKQLMEAFQHIWKCQLEVYKCQLSHRLLLSQDAYLVTMTAALQLLLSVLLCGTALRDVMVHWVMQSLMHIVLKRQRWTIFPRVRNDLCSWEDPFPDELCKCFFSAIWDEDQEKGPWLLFKAPKDPLLLGGGSVGPLFRNFGFCYLHCLAKPSNLPAVAQAVTNDELLAQGVPVVEFVQRHLHPLQHLIEGCGILHKAVT